MRRKLCVALLVLCVAAVIVKSETTIEVDENGDEYEVKRFNIEGRNLHEGRSQCVVSRRKRSTASAQAAAAAMASAGTSDEPSDEQSDEMMTSGKKKGHKDTMLQTTETADPSQIDTDTDADESDYDDAGADQSMSVHQQAMAYHDIDDDEDDDSDYEDEGAAVVLPIGNVPPRRQQHGVSVSVSSAGHGGAVVGSSVHSAASSLSSASAALANPLVVLPSAQGAQVVNPNTHAILALEPVSFLGVGEDQADEHDDLLYNEEISPVTTTAIWSTGDDDDLYDDLLPIKDNNNKVQKNKNKNKKTNKKKTNKKKKNNNNKVSLNNKNKNKNKNRNRRPQRFNRPRPSFNRRRPANRRGNRKPLSNRRKNSSSKPTQEKRKTSQAAASNAVKRQKLANRRKNNRKVANRKQLASKRKHNRNHNIKDQGTKVFTKTQTTTATGTANEDKDVNCIIIRKEPTTPRPFWNILGRDAGQANVQGSGHFGKRKRAHLRFHA